MKTFFGSLLILISLVFALSGCRKVDTHEVGLKVRWGKIDSEPLTPDLYFVNPIGTQMVTYDAREARKELSAPTFTKDMQEANLALIITYSLDKTRIKEIHTTYGRDWDNKIVIPVVLSSVKDVIGQWEADQVVNGREKATKEINDAIIKKLEGKPVHFSQLVIANIDFSDDFEKAIEAKQIATQEAIKARNKTVQIEEEARQNVIRAKAEADAKLALATAEAKAVEIVGEALNKNKDVVKIKFVEKWDGKAPHTLILGNDSSVLVSPDK